MPAGILTNFMPLVSSYNQKKTKKFLFFCFQGVQKRTSGIKSIDILPDDGILNLFYLTIYTDNTTLYSKRNHASDSWQQRELACQLNYDLRGTLVWSRKWLVNFNSGKTQLVIFDHLNTYGAIHVIRFESVFGEKSSLKILGFFYLGLAFLHCL